MSDIQSLKNRIRDWLVEDEIEAVEILNDYSDFQFTLSNAFGLGFTINVAKPKQKSVLQIVTKLSHPPEIQKSMSSLDDEEKLELFESLKVELLKIGVDYEISDNLDSITFVKFVYLNDMTRTLFMESLKMVRNATLLVISLLSRRFTTGYQSTPPHTHLHVSSPYG
ncbi:MAG TPA: DUF2299 family protein [Candidatus Nitrosotalea sp.]|nr:DUF2299 family protein [Candidatus Nitrosotalea sp.]